MVHSLSPSLSRTHMNLNVAQRKIQDRLDEWGANHGQEQVKQVQKAKSRPLKRFGDILWRPVSLFVQCRKSGKEVSLFFYEF